MIRVLVMANESLLADFIMSTLSQEVDLDVFRATRDEIGLRRDYSVVIVIDDEVSDIETVKLKEIIRDGGALLMVKVSLTGRNVLIDESHQLVNPGVGQVIDLIRDFSMKNSRKDPEADAGTQKKMKMIPDSRPASSARKNKYRPSGMSEAVPQRTTPFSVNDRGMSTKSVSFLFPLPSKT